MGTRNRTKQLCVLAMLIAVFVVLDYVATLTSGLFGGAIKISFSGLPVIFAALLFGPLPGMIVGLLGSFLGQMLTYGFTATTLLWILPAGVRGLAIGLLFLAFRRSTKVWVMSLEILLSSLLVTAVNTLVIYADSVIYGYYQPAVVFGALGVRLVSALITSAAYAAIVLPIYYALRRHGSLAS